MALTRIDDIETHTMNQWFANLVDTLNYDLEKIMGAVSGLENALTAVDTAPIDYLTESLAQLVTNVNDNFDIINERLDELESRLDNLEGMEAE